MTSGYKKDFLLIQKVVENYLVGVIEGDYSKVVSSWYKEGNRLLVNSEGRKIIILSSLASKEFTNLKPNPEVK